MIQLKTYIIFSALRVIHHSLSDVNCLQHRSTSGRYNGKAFMPYSNEDFILTGDDVTSDILRSPTTVYIGDGSVEGFTFVKVCTLTLYLYCDNQIANRGCFP